jgi:carbamoyltransferase
LGTIPSWFKEKLRIKKALKKELKYKKDIFFLDHHMAHAASFLASPFKKAAILTVDGVGEWTTTAYGLGKGKDITLIKEIKFPHSLGLLYSTITAYLGFSVNNSEYKVMGLAPYGNMNKKTNKYYERLRKTIDVKDDGSYHLDMSYFVYTYKNRMPSRKLCSLLEGPIRRPESAITERHKDIAAALQLVVEETIFKILNNLYKITKEKNLVLSGGVALNSVMNGKILRNTPFKRVWAQPDPGDGGTSLTAAIYAYNSILGKKRSYVLDNPYLGPKYADKEIKEFLDKNNINYSKFSSPKELTKSVAKIIKENSVVGWFELGMEWGPRALGARSILSNPCNPEMQEILNLKVKHREKFRPFAPVVCEDDALKYFECDRPIPEATDFMLMVYPIKKPWRSKIPAVTHVDGSGRLQTVRRFQNPLYYDLIKEFGKLSGIPILINTSFNIRGEPIVCSPYDAYKCMMGTGVDYLVLGSFLIKRDDNLKDAWDSEKYAKD